MEATVSARAAELVETPCPTRSPSEIVPDDRISSSTFSPLYQFGLVLVAATMVLLPVLYLVTIGLVAWGTYYHGANVGLKLLNAPVDSPREVLFKIAGYFGPLFFGVVLCLTMLKTLVARRPKPSQPCALSSEDAPELFALIKRLCRAVGAPIPSRVEMTCEVNASASYRKLFGGDLVLTIGLPLVAGLNLREFTGVLAHELGHLSQATAMRLVIIIRKVQIWFAQGVYGRDAWDFHIAFWASVSPWYLTMLLIVAKGGIWLSRVILWVFMAIGQAMSCFMLRQMEYDADRFEIKVAGTDAFISSVQRMFHLSLAADGAHKHLGKTWKRHRQLYDRLPEFILGRAEEISIEVTDMAHDIALQRKASLFDTHPPAAKRLARARKANQPGILRPVAAPASCLLPQFEELSRRVTRNQYEIWLGPNFDPSDLVALEDTVQQEEHDSAADRQEIQRYFRGVYDNARFFSISQDQVLSNFTEEPVVSGIKSARQEMEQLFPEAQTDFEIYRQADAHMLSAWQAVHLARAGFQWDAAELNLPPVPREPEQVGSSSAPADAKTGGFSAEDVHAAAVQQRAAAASELSAFERAVVTRLTLCLQVIRLPRLVAASPQAMKLRNVSYEALSVLALYEEIARPLDDLRKDGSALRVLLQYQGQQPRTEASARALSRLNTRLLDNLNRIRARVRKVKYPFPHRKGMVTVGEYLQSQAKHDDPFERTLLEANTLREGLTTLYDRIIASLITVTEWVEQKLVDQQPGPTSPRPVRRTGCPSAPESGS